jgi:hypothetical protein
MAACATDACRSTAMTAAVAALLSLGGRWQCLDGCTREIRPVILKSTIACPHCGTAKTEAMPTDACQFFYDCAGCGALLRPKPCDCCVFCSYGSVPCPPIQENGAAGLNFF